MNTREYLRQAYRLDQRIDSDIKEMERLREMAYNVSSSSLGEKFNPSRNLEAPYVRCIERIITLEEKINAEIDKFVALKEQIRDMIDKVDDTDERMVLRYRYIHNFTWDQIGAKLNANRTTVYRWHNAALGQVILPENPIII